MAHLKKLLICPYFGPFPEWMDLFLADFQNTMKPQGYTLVLDTDLPDFKRRVKEKLGIDCTIVRGQAKIWDYRCALGFLYEEEIKGYDYWGHCDLDMVFGNVSKFIPDEKLSTLDIYSGHDEYVCGCFSLYKNCTKVNKLFTFHPEWGYELTNPTPTGWVEKGYSELIEHSVAYGSEEIKYQFDFHQGNPWTNIPILKKENGGLFQDANVNATRDNPEYKWIEVMFFHFRHSKRWPL